MIYLDNASTSFPKMNSLYKKISKTYEQIGINFSRNKSEKSEKNIDIKNKLINNLKIMVSTNQHQVILNPSATYSLNEIILGLNYEEIKTIYVSPFEHNSVMRVLNKIKKNKNIEIQILKFNKFNLDEKDMKLKFMSKKPDLVIINHASNVFGNILPVKEIFEEVKKYNGITVLDGSQTVGLLNFSKIIAQTDFLVFAGHKTLYGPSGIGGYFYNENIKIEPLLYGGTGIKSEDLEMPESGVERFEAGSPNTLGIIGLELSTTEMLEIGIENIREKKQKILKNLYEILEEYDYDLQIQSELENNIGIISIVGENNTSQELEAILGDYEIITRSGLQCAPSAHKHIGTSEGTLRLSVGYFTTEEEIEELKNILDEIF